MTTSTGRKQQTYEEIAVLERQLADAEPDSLPRSFWSAILEAVERLPAREERAWKDANITRLRLAVKGIEPHG